MGIRKSGVDVCCLAGFALWSMAASLAPAAATTYQLQNVNFGGGIHTCYSGGGCSDPTVIGSPSVFGITGASVSSSANTVTVTIDTPYANVPTTAAAEGTTYGSLFLNTSPTGTGVYNSYAPGNYNYAAVMNGVTTNGQLNKSGTLSIYAIPPSQTPVNYPGTNVPTYYQTTNGQVIMSNMNGSPVTYPYYGNPWWWFRQGEAVLFSPKAGATPFLTGTWNTNTSGEIIFSILVSSDPAFLANSFAFSWAMTCANDIIQALAVPQVIGGGGGGTVTPVPAALPLFLSGLGLIGFLGWRRKRGTVSA
jgi:hypothetical protein